MKKVLLLSVVASTIIMAGGDIAPVEPIVVPVVESGWKFDGNMVAYYQTQDSTVNDLFSTAASADNFGIQLRAVNDDLFWGLGAGFEVTGMASSSLIADNTIQTAGAYNRNIGGALTQAYLTYNIEAINTGLKLGRQTLPKSLSPFAFSEQWQPVQNTFDAALVVNSSIPDTTLVYAFVDKANTSYDSTGVNSDLGLFNSTNELVAGTSNGIHMVTAQNKSIEGLTLTGSFYYAQDMLVAGTDVMIGWGDAKFKYDGYCLAVQGGSVMVDSAGTDTMAYGAKLGAKFNLFDMDFDTSVAYSGVDEGTVAVKNFGGVKTPLYTQMVLNQGLISQDSTAIVARVGAEVYGGHFGIAFGMMTDENKITPVVAPATPVTTDSIADSIELDVTYKTKITENTTLFAAYVMTDADKSNSIAGATDPDARNFVRVWARYNFK